MEHMHRDLGEKVLIYRRRLKMSQEQFADYLRRNGLQNRRWTAPDISELENEKMDPRLSELKDLAFAMETTVEALVNEAKGAYLNTERDSRTYLTPDYSPVNANVRSEWHQRDDIDLRDVVAQEDAKGAEKLPIAVGW